MKLATMRDGTPDGRLHLVSRDLSRCQPAKAAETLQLALESLGRGGTELRRETAELEEGGGTAFDPAAAMAPLPRAWQWLDGSAYESHAELMATAFGIEKQKGSDRPLMYQGMSHQFYGPTADVRLPSEADGIDFEGEFGVVLTETPMGCDASSARDHIALIVQINDWSLRAVAPIEMKTGFGWIYAKPACSMAPVAVTPDELGDAWRDARVDLPLLVDWNGKRFGAASGYAMAFGFDDLVAHAAYSRDLVAGTIIGSGTVSNENYREVGSSCIAERRAIEMIDGGEATTGFMRYGDTIRMEARMADGSSPFGAIDQKVVRP